jgi:DNA repair photolyase
MIFETAPSNMIYQIQPATSDEDRREGCPIYIPGGPAKEYSPWACNFYNGCGHKCKYCYVPLFMHMTREKFDAGAVPKKSWLENLRKDAAKVQALGIKEQVLCCFMTDAYNNNNTSLTRPSLQILQEFGMAFCILTKGGKRSLADLDLFRPDRDCFASTLTSLDDKFSKLWEPNAALPEDRMQTLKAFHDAGIFTWVSLEPTLSTEASLEIVLTTCKFVNHYKIGKANYLGEYGKKIDWRKYTLQMMHLCMDLGVSHYFKHDLQMYLPDGYFNPMRVAQHY